MLSRRLYTMTPLSDKVRLLAPMWSVLWLAQEAPPALVDDGGVAPCLEDWVLKDGCVDQCNNEGKRVGVLSGFGHQRQAMVEPMRHAPPPKQIGLRPCMMQGGGRWTTWPRGGKVVIGGAGALRAMSLPSMLARMAVVRTRPRPVCTCSNNSVDQAASANINSCK